MTGDISAPDSVSGTEPAADSAPAPAEVPKRRNPDREAIRHLFAFSGNVCAFPGCNHTLIDGRGKFVAEVCHIEAAELGGERFNPAMTNLQRSLQSNLLLLCHQHHVETNDEAVWTVEKMHELKAAHERQFEEAVARIAQSAITDITKAAVVGEPKTLARWNVEMGAGLTPEQLSGTLSEMVEPLLARLRKLAPTTRGVLLIVAERGEQYRSDLGITTIELEQVTEHEADDLWPHIETLRRYSIASIDEDFDGSRWVYTLDLDGWPFWGELRDYCEKTGLELGAFINDLRFDLLD